MLLHYVSLKCLNVQMLLLQTLSKLYASASNVYRILNADLILHADLILRFGRPIPQLCMISSRVIDYIVDTHGQLLRSLDQPFLSQDNLQTYADAIHQKGAALDICWGFIDGTVRPISRPKECQRVVYNGHKRVHAIKFQSVVTPSGMIANLYGPVEGRLHDSGTSWTSWRHSFSPTGQPLCIYGDPAYFHRVHLQCPFARRAVL